jgi:NTE family protein
MKTSAFDRVVLVLQGGGALGAYQAGVYQALQEHDFAVNWIAGTSIGAINGAIIAGNAPGNRIAKLREFWGMVSNTDCWGLAQNSEAARSGCSAWSVMQSVTMGRPGFFSPRWFDPLRVFLSGSAERAGFYDVGPLRKTLERVVDFDLLNGGPIRFSIGAVKILSGTLRYFDTKAERLGPEHILASGALPPGFPAVRIGSDLYWDGGIYSNTPLEIVLDDIPRRNTLCVMLSLFNPRGAEPGSIDEVEKRHKEIMYGSRMHEHVMAYRKIHNLRRALQSIYALLPSDVKDNPEIQEVGNQGCETTMHIVELIYPGKNWESCFKDADFSRAAVEERWRLGHLDASRLLQRAPWQDPVPPRTGVVVHTIGPGYETKESQDLSFR